MRLKKIAKEHIYLFVSKSNKQIKTLIKNMDTISFDIFDTLLKRDVLSPEEVFSVMENQLLKEGLPIAKRFRELRIQAERKARELYPAREVTLKEIYDCFPLPEEDKTNLMQIECETEIFVSVPHIPMQKIYEECVRQGKMIYFISDMYLPTDTIEKMLEKNGYISGKLYVSSEYGYTKQDGKLFAFIQKKENLNLRKWMHIGDSISADYLIPKRRGICAALIEHEPQYNNIINRKIYRKNIDYRRLNHFINIHIDCYSDPYEKIGYAVLGPLLYGFSCWLEREIPNDNTIVFLAREGALLQKAFEIVSERPSVYLYISRRAANVSRIATAQNPDEISQYKVRTIHKGHTQKELAKIYDLSDNEVDIIFKKNNLDEDRIVIDQKMEKQVLNAIWESVKRKGNQQHDYLQKYLEQLEISDKCALVDEGMHGTIQVLLSESHYKIKNKPIQWNGYYMVTMKEPSDSPYSFIKKHGFLHENSDKSKLLNGIRYSIPFFEMLFLSTHGTTLRYEQTEEGMIRPVFSELDNNEEINRIIEKIQNAGIQFVKDYSASYALKSLENNVDTFIGNYIALAKVPSRGVISLFCEFNSNDGNPYKFMSEHTLTYYVFHPMQFCYDLKKHPGKAWFLKSVFKLPLPYIQILNLIRRFLKDVV